jgi:hypothetical protein
MLTLLMVVELSGQEIAIQAAKNFRALRRLGVTVCKTIDSVIATRCRAGMTCCTTTGISIRSPNTSASALWSDNPARESLAITKGNRQYPGVEYQRVHDV